MALQICACPVGLSLSIDEVNCVKPKKCAFKEYQCYTGECIPHNHLCDNKHDCIHGDDENLEHCDHPKCPPDQFLCFDKKKCVDRKLQCNGAYDCEDKSDEICNSTCTNGEYLADCSPTCSLTQFLIVLCL